MMAGWLAYVGCRTTRQRNARGDGLTVWRMEAGGWQQIQLLPLLNPSFLAFDRGENFLYAVHGDSTDVSAFSIDRNTGELAFLNQAPCGGLNPVHLAVSPANDVILIANHTAGGDQFPNVAALSRHADGSVGVLLDRVALTGKTGPHRVEQPFPKPHQVAYDPSRRFILVPDKGCDLVRTFALSDSGQLREVGRGTPGREMSGPRHISFHPGKPLAYVINELDSSIACYRYQPDTGQLDPFQVISCLPDDFVGDSRGAEITVSADARFVYVSNRGSDTIGAFAIRAADGGLNPIGWTVCGKTPRYFTQSPCSAALVVANEEDDTITSLALSAQTGKPGAAEIVARTGSPTCILFRKIEG